MPARDRLVLHRLDEPFHKHFELLLLERIEDILLANRLEQLTLGLGTRSDVQDHEHTLLQPLEPRNQLTPVNRPILALPLALAEFCEHRIAAQVNGPERRPLTLRGAHHGPSKSTIAATITSPRMR